MSSDERPSENEALNDHSCARARIRTPRAARFAKQLISHWGRKAESVLTDEDGVVAMHFLALDGWPASTVYVRSEPDTLVVTIQVDDEKDVPPYCDSAAEHLHRFAGPREMLHIEWVRVSSDAGP